ncbi:MAG TPA: tetratricopeptide repeat protein [Candidatus Gastranaerophilales bacterium]|nr:tetratricopeptide repeat protein [Candidatus Gastranaerophilales bacterium]
MLTENTHEEIFVFSGADINQILDLAQKSHENYLIRANAKDLDKALVYYLEAIKLNPEISEVHYKLASLLWEKGEIDLNSAIKHCKKAVELSPYSAKARLHLGYFLKTAGKYLEAEKTFQEAISLGKFCSARPRLVLAATIIERLKTTGFNFFDLFKSFYCVLTGIVMSIYDYEVIRMIYKACSEKSLVLKYKINGNMQKTLRNYKKTVEIYEKAAEQTGRKELFYSRTGDLFIELQNPKQAVEYYRHALKDSPDDVVLWAKLAETLENHDKRNINAIVECYSNISRLQPANSKVFYELGHLYLRNENKFNAINAFKRALELEPKNAFYHNSLAYALVQLQDYDGAINEYQQAIMINPDNEWTSIVAQALGAIYHQIKDNLDAAIVAYQTSILMDRNNIDAYIALGEAYQDKNDLDNAINAYCGAVKINSGSAKIYCNLGLLLWEKGYVEEAMVAYQKSISLNPEYAIAFNNLGVVYLDGCCNPQEAVKMFDSAIKYSPNYTLAYYNKGRAYQLMRNLTKAAEYFQMAFDINTLTCELDNEEIEGRIKSLFKAE